MTQQLISTPINLVQYDGCGIDFYIWPQNIDYRVVANDDQLREFCEVEQPNEMRDLEIWLFNQGKEMIVPQIVLDFVSHSRHEWRRIIEVENPN